MYILILLIEAKKFLGSPASIGRKRYDEWQRMFHLAKNTLKSCLEYLEHFGLIEMKKGGKTQSPELFVVFPIGREKRGIPMAEFQSSLKEEKEKEKESILLAEEREKKKKKKKSEKKSEKKKRRR